MRQGLVDLITFAASLKNLLDISAGCKGPPTIFQVSPPRVWFSSLHLRTDVLTLM